MAQIGPPTNKNGQECHAIGSTWPLLSLLAAAYARDALLLVLVLLILTLGSLTCASLIHLHRSMVAHGITH